MPTLGDRVASTLYVDENMGASDVEGKGEETGRFNIGCADAETAIILGDSLQARNDDNIIIT